MNILFRADAGLHMGTGHIHRCLTLAKKLASRGHNCEFICRPFVGNLIDHIRMAGFLVHKLSKLDARNIVPIDTATWLGCSLVEELNEIPSVLLDRHYDWVVVDHYSISDEWHSGIRGRAGKVMVVDDLCNTKHDCELLLNQNCGVDQTAYQNLVSNETVCLIGPEFALLRDEFSKWRAPSIRYRSVPEKKRIFLSMGGVDIANTTVDVLRSLESIDDNAPLLIEVIVGPSSPHLKTVIEAASQSRHNINVLTAPSDIAKIMATSDIGIGAAGSTTWERCCLGLPTFQVAIADNQLQVCKYLNSANIVIGYESIMDLSRKISNDYNTLCSSKLQSLSTKGLEMCDGNGSNRVVSVMETL